ncbi:MAG: CRISPR-associated endonuclease Cas1 [Thermoguttaceae bacterium]|nr:CRISPR-associated endonuclease Cas1 [Thermoguttaceae bacterium]MDW8080162.1 CRISPR-associated endonuclease Cas1 [Thermoguttaceae bacterium]
MSVLYVLTDGASIRKRSDSLAIFDPDGNLLQEVELRQVNALVAFSSVQVTTPALVELLEAGVDVAFLSHGGKLLAKLTSPTSGNILLRRKQFQAFCDPGVCLRWARAAIHAKLANQIAFLRYLAAKQEDPSPELSPLADQIASWITPTLEAATRDVLRGIEGLCARFYWQGFGQALRVDGLVFTGRRYHPATDPVNATLSFAYTLLTNTIHHLLDATGLDPFLGFFHADESGRPSLALDLLEPFRPAVVDRFVLRLFNQKVLKPDDFQTLADGSVRLQPQPRRRFLEQWEATLDRAQIRQALAQQIEDLRHALTNSQDPPPFYRWSNE